MLMNFCHEDLSQKNNFESYYFFVDEDYSKVCIASRKVKVSKRTLRVIHINQIYYVFFSGYNSSYTFPNLPNLAAQAAAAQAQANQTGVTAVSVSGNGGASSVTPGSCNTDWPEYSGVDR